MSDDLLLTLLWLLPALGALLVLFIPGRAETAIKGTALAITVLTFVLTLVAYGLSHQSWFSTDGIGSPHGSCT